MLADDAELEEDRKVGRDERRDGVAKRIAQASAERVERIRQASRPATSPADTT